MEDIECDKESVRISSIAIMSVMEETFEKDHEEQERMVLELRNELASFKKSNTERIKQIQ